jgi:hypothetical protein
VPTDNVVMNCKLDCFGMNPTFASNPESAHYAAMLTGDWTLHLYDHLWRRTAKSTLGIRLEFVNVTLFDCLEFRKLDSTR